MPTVQVPTSGAARPLLEDRNPTQVTRFYSATLAPHGAASRWTYTVPDGKLAKIESVYAGVQRATVHSAAGVSYVLIEVDDGTNLPIILDARLTENSANVVGENDRRTARGVGILPAGTIVQARTLGTDTGGTVSYNAQAIITEYDAA